MIKPKKAVAALIALIGILLTPAVAEARLARGVPIIAVTAPVLQSVSVPFGAGAASGRGSVRLSGLDGTTTANQPQTYSGIDLWVSGTPCATWSMSFVSGRSSADYNIIAANTPEGTGAVTPNPTSTGAANATGSYGWNVSCKDAGGNNSNTVTLTYVTIAHVAMIGTYDRTDFGVTPSGFSNTSGGQIWLSVGGDFHAPAANNCCVKMNFGNGGYTNLVTITVADASRPPYLPAFQISTLTAGSGMANYRVTGLVLSGPLTANQDIAGFNTQLAGADNIQWDNIHGYFSSALILGTWGSSQVPIAINNGGCATGAVNCGFADSDFDYIGTGSNPGPNTYIHNVFFRHFYNNCYFFSNSASHVDIADGGCIAGMVATGGVHIDNCQIADGATPSFVTIKRFLLAQGDGDTQNQGCPFRGSSFNSTCYVDDGTGAHGPGTTLTVTVGGLLSNSQGSYLVIPSVWDYSSKVTISCTSGSCGGKTTATLGNISATNVGSPGSPVNCYTAGGFLDWNMDGVIVSQSEPNGFGTNGEGGTSSLQDFAFFQMNATPAGEASYTGSISAGGLLTVTTQPTSNYPGETPCLVACGRISVAGVCDYCGPNIASQASGTTEGIGTYNLSSWGLGAVASTTIKNSAGYPIADNTVGAISQNFCTTPAVHTGTFTIAYGTDQAGASLCGAPITNTTTSNVLLSGGGAAMPAANYASGQTPQAYLQAQTWSSRVSTAPLLTNAQILTLNCLALKPKIGGGLDLGGGLWIGPVTGETDAGTHTGGGNWTTAGGTDSGIAIPGCSAAP